MAEKKMVKFQNSWGVYQTGDIAAFPTKKADELLAAKVKLQDKAPIQLCIEPNEEELRKLHAADTLHYETTKATAEGKFDKVPSQHPWAKHHPELHKKFTEAPAVKK